MTMTIEETKSKFDSLFGEVKAYRKSSHFRELLAFCAHFKTLAPYNAMLVHLQMPHARFVLTPKDWRKYYRKIRAFARPLLILVPFGPVDFVYEIQDTYTPKKEPHKLSEYDIIEDIERPFRVDGRIHPHILNRLISFMQYHGIAYDPNMVAGVNYAAEIVPLPINEESRKLYIPINKTNIVDVEAKYLIRTNRLADDGQKIASIAHELGHLFCYHLPAPKEWGKAWDIRNLDEVAEEFEAEAVARMVCDRLEIVNRSEQYLDSYLAQNKEIPPHISIENICLAANKILTMCLGSQKMTYRDGLLFKHDEEFQNKVKSLKPQKYK